MSDYRWKGPFLFIVLLAALFNNMNLNTLFMDFNIRSLPEHYPQISSINQFLRDYVFDKEANNSNFNTSGQNTSIANPPLKDSPQFGEKNRTPYQTSAQTGQHGLNLPKQLVFTENCLPIPPFPPPPMVPQEDSTAPHVIVNHGGRLGNKMCQYLSVYLLRHLFGVRVSIMEGMNLTLSLYFRNISLPIRDRKNTTSIKYSRLYQLLYEAGMKEANTSGGIVQGPLLSKSYYVYNHPCPRDLFMNYRSLLRSVLVYKGDILDQAKNNIDLALFHRNLTLKDATLVTAHVRRTDYTHFIKDRFNFTPIPPIYYERAFEFFRKRVDRPVFVVVCDDRVWCSDDLPADDVVMASSPIAVVDQAVLTYGAHTITSYGTFSFMGALLAGGHIIHPINNNTKYTYYSCVRSLDFHFISRDIDYYYPNN